MPRPYRKLPQLFPQDVERFWSKVDKTPGQGPKGDCWFWIGAQQGKGYGEFTLCAARYKKKSTFLAHRIAYRITFDDDPESLLICHTCDMEPCCNPAHLFKGTDLDNVTDMITKGRMSSREFRIAVLRAAPVRCGEQATKTKLTVEKVIEIRRQYAMGIASMRELGKANDVSHKAVGALIHRQSRKHVP